MGPLVGPSFLVPLFSTLALFSFCARTHADDAANTLDRGSAFITRPDIQVPRWDVTVHDQERLSLGYWFLAPYGADDQSLQLEGNWTTPLIFDQAGELIWSGAALTQGFSASDFRVSNVLGEDMLTFLYPRNHSLVVLDKHFNIFKQLEISQFDSHERYNSHELNFVNDGTRTLFFFEQHTKANQEESTKIGFDDGRCLIRDTILRESNLLEDWRFVYRWSASKRIDLTESTATNGTVEQRCNETTDGWDWVQANSADKFDRDGSYLLSARYTNTIYKILRSGDIAWRLGGNRSDFKADFAFSRQNHARIQSYNDTHTIISFLDNGDPESGADQSSRGLLVALRADTEPKTATLVAEYAHPGGAGSFLADGGSMQVLPGGNIFSGWVEKLLISEHDADGRLLMEARAEQQWMRSYRSYKFPFVGEPAQPPDIYAETYPDDDARMIVYASWNGAAEVESWNVYKSTSDSKFTRGDSLAYAKRSGFETMIDIHGYATHVVVEAFGKDGAFLGRSNVFETIRSSSTLEDVPSPEEATEPAESKAPEEATTPEEAMADDKQQPPDVASTTPGEEKSWKDTATSRGGIASFLGVLAIIAGLVLVLRYWRRRRTSWISKHNRKPSDNELLSRNKGMYAIEDDEEEDDVNMSSR